MTCADVSLVIYGLLVLEVVVFAVLTRGQDS